MAVTYHLVGVLLLAIVVGGQMQDEPGNVNPDAPNFDTEALRPLVESMINNPYLCKACESVVGFLKNVTENQNLLDELVQLLLPVCDWVPYILHTNCTNCIKDIPNMVKQWADKYLDPQTDCAWFCTGPRMMTYDNAIPLMNNFAKMMKARKPLEY